MSDIQHYSVDRSSLRDPQAMWPWKGEGPVPDPIIVVTYAHHLAEVERVRKGYESQDCYTLGYAHGLNASVLAERQRIVEIVEAIEHWTAYDQHGDMHACYASDPIAAITGDNPCAEVPPEPLAYRGSES